jgi:uncharacterized protein YbbK (DUF523 family)
MVLISSCIAGVKCRYDAASSYNENLLKKIGCNYMHICPELLAGFKVPRKPCEIYGGTGDDVLAGNAKIIDQDGLDITGQMLVGIEKALQICLENKVTKAYLRAKSPTCGYNKIYDGSFSSTLKKGSGVFSALLIKNGIEIIEVE